MQTFTNSTLRLFTLQCLTELRDLDARAPNTDVYFATLHSGGNVMYSIFDDLGRLKQSDPTDTAHDLAKTYGRFVFEVEKDPTLKAKLDKLVKSGMMKIEKSKMFFGKGDYEKRRWVEKYPDLFPTVADVPQEMPKYEAVYSGSHNNIIKVDTVKQQIDLSLIYKNEMSRREDPSQEHRHRDAYVIPSGSTAFEHNQIGLQKLLKHLLQNDRRVTLNYRLVGDEKYRNKTIRDVISQPREVDSAITGQNPIIMFHGTSTKRWESIQRVGLQPGKGSDVYCDLIPGYSEHNVYLTFSHVNAENYATRQAIKDKSQPIVLKVQVPDYTNFRPDEDNMGYMQFSRDYQLTTNDVLYIHDDWNEDNLSLSRIKKGKRYSVQLLLRAIHGKKIDKDSEFLGMQQELYSYIKNALPKISLKNGTIAYEGRIPPKFIKPSMEYPLTKLKIIKKYDSPSEEEYAKKMQITQKATKRYDESRAYETVD